MPGVDLYDSFTIAAHSMRPCCAKTLNYAVDVHPTKRAPLKTEPEGQGLKVTLDCPVCKKTTVIHADRRAVRVET